MCVCVCVCVDIVVPVLKDVGCYVNSDDTKAILFTSDKNLTLITGDQAFTQAMVIGETMYNASIPGHFPHLRKKTT